MDQEKTYRWVKDRLRELHSGTIADADRHKLAALAKENPFVADALEGYELFPHINHADHLESLAHRIKGVKRDRRRWLIPNLTVTAVAASLILIVGFWAVMSRLSTEEKQGEDVVVTDVPLGVDAYKDTMPSATAEEDSAIAMVESPKTTSVLEMPAVVAPPEKTYAQYQKPVFKKEKLDAALNQSSQADSRMSMNSESPADKDDTATEPIPAPPVLDETEVLSGNPAAATSAFERLNLSNQMDPDLMRLRATGKIVSPEGEPLIGANILVNGTNQVAVSDADGKFEVFLPRPETEVDVYYSGYENATVTLKQGEEDKTIVLQEVDSLSETAVVSGKTERSRKTMMEAAPKLDSPTFNAKNNLLFIDYLKENSKYPIADSTFNSAKMVTLDFLIDSKYRPSQITVYQSSYNPKLDEEAIRLIKKGPDWECLKATSMCRARYSIYFK